MLLTKPVVAVVAATKPKAGAEAQWREGNGEDRDSLPALQAVQE